MKDSSDSNGGQTMVTRPSYSIYNEYQKLYPEWQMYYSLGEGLPRRVAAMQQEEARMSEEQPAVMKYAMNRSVV